jgi:putative zinc finger/helix-turn-helix YgiT family protein
MKGICPNCEDYKELELIEVTEVIRVRRELIEVVSNLLKCESCSETFEDPTLPSDPHAKAYREYRKRHGMLQPEEIRSFREQNGLTQLEMGKILGWDAITLSRYENGALQTEAHEKAFRLAMEPHNLLRLLEEAREGAFDEGKKARIVHGLRQKEITVEEMEHERLVGLVMEELPHAYLTREGIDTEAKARTIIDLCHAHFTQEVERLENELELERMRLAACGVAAMSNTESSRQLNRLADNSPYWSASYNDARAAVGREMEERKRAETAEADLKTEQIAYENEKAALGMAREKIAELEAQLAECQEELFIIKRSIIDPENQPSQFGTVTLDMYEALQAQLAAKPEQAGEERCECGHRKDTQGLDAFLRLNLDSTVSVSLASCGGYQAKDYGLTSDNPIVPVKVFPIRLPAAKSEQEKLVEDIKDVLEGKGEGRIRTLFERALKLLEADDEA